LLFWREGTTAKFKKMAPTKQSALNQTRTKAGQVSFPNWEGHKMECKRSLFRGFDDDSAQVVYLNNAGSTLCVFWFVVCFGLYVLALAWPCIFVNGLTCLRGACFASPCPLVSCLPCLVQQRERATAEKHRGGGNRCAENKGNALEL